MKAEAVLVRDLLSKSTTYSIPNFQRRYRWQREQWTQLFDDVCREAERLDSEKDGHFLGSIVLHRNTVTPPRGDFEWIVIDGQQRITSLLLLLAALRDAFSFHGDIQTSSHIDKELLSVAGSDHQVLERLLPTPLDKKQYVSTLRERTASGRFGEGYDYFLKLALQYRHTNGRPLETILETVLDRLLVVKIEVEGTDSINSIFNTLNSKGLPLNAGDLIKNELLLTFDDVTARQLYLEKWAPVEEFLVTDVRGRIDDRKLLTFFWARELRFSKSVTQKNIFTVFEERHRKSLRDLGGECARQEVALAEIDDIWLDFENYRLIDDHRHIGAKFTAEIREHLRFFKSWGSPIPIPIVLWILGAHRKHSSRVTQGDTAQALGLLKSFLVRRALCGYPSNNLNRLLSTVPYALENEALASSDANPISFHLAKMLNKPSFEWPSNDTVLRHVPTVPLLKSVKLTQARTILEIALQAETRSRSKLLMLLPRNLKVDDLLALDVDPSVVDECVNVLPYTLGNTFLPGSFSDTGTIDKKMSQTFSDAESPISINSRIKGRSHTLAQSLLEQLVSLDLRPEALQDVEAEDLILNLLEIIPERSWTSIEVLASVARCTPEEALARLSERPAYHVRFVREFNGEALHGLPSLLTAQINSEDESSHSVFTPKNFLSSDDLYLLIEDSEDIYR